MSDVDTHAIARLLIEAEMDAAIDARIGYVVGDRAQVRVAEDDARCAGIGEDNVVVLRP